ncbi:acetyl-CoA carboxylase biotin carboxylase subunit family protein [Caulobacter sp. S45]|uniref:ATP-grasp domain-containing protein n=1 Tax=Caulobacter sp. S45 TaxID=1641861 RepID=UPI00131CABAA|nr:hypothetical protein [Caulobacter sp. S45]
MLTETGGYGSEYIHLEHLVPFRNNPLVEYRANELIRQFHPTHVVATSEYDLLRAARLRDLYSLPGQGVESALAFRDKVIMKDYAKRAVKVPGFYERLASATDLYRLIQERGFPLVVKPVDGAGSRSTYILRQPDHVIAFLKKESCEDFDAEEFIDGQMYILDGLYDRDSIVLSWASRYKYDCLSFASGQQACLLQLDDANPMCARLREFADRLLEVMPTPETTTFHLEAFENQSGDLVLCEIASRTGGSGALAEIGELRYGMNIHEAWVRAQAGDRSLIENFAPQDNGVQYGFVQAPLCPRRAPSPPKQLPFDWAVRYHPEPSELARMATESSDKVAALVIAGASEAQLDERTDIVLSWLDGNAFSPEVGVTHG